MTSSPPTQSETIPDEIMRAAQKVFDDRLNSICLTWDHSFGLMSEDQREGLRRSFRRIGYHDIVPAFAAALFAERKRAAEIVIAANNGSNKWREVAFSILSQAIPQSRQALLLSASAIAGADAPPSAPASHSAHRVPSRAKETA